MARTALGLLRETLVVQQNSPPTLSVSSLTRTSTTATVTVAVPHGYISTDYVTIAGCDGATTAWNAKFKVVSVTSTTVFTFTCSSALTTPATGTITVVYTSNAQGGQGNSYWRTLDSIAAEMIPLGAMERLQIQAVQSSVTYRFRVRARADLEPTMRLLWIPSAPQGATRKTLAIAGVIPCEDGRQFQYLEASEVAA